MIYFNLAKQIRNTLEMGEVEKWQHIKNVT